VIIKINKNVLILHGDGIGHEVCNEAKTILELINNRYELGLINKGGLVGGSA
jgi:3-isopropylmalate dehydrogenase